MSLPDDLRRVIYCKVQGEVVVGGETLHRVLNPLVPKLALPWELNVFGLTFLCCEE